MKLTMSASCKNSIRKIWSDDISICYGIAGTVKDFLSTGLLDWCDYPPDTYCFIPGPGSPYPVRFGKTMADVLKHIKREGATT